MAAVEAISHLNPREASTAAEEEDLAEKPAGSRGWRLDLGRGTRNKEIDPADAIDYVR